MTTEAKRLAEDNLNLARFVARQFRNTPYAYEDLEATAFLALTRAAIRYDGSTKFPTFAVPVMRNAILERLRKKRPVTVSVETQVADGYTLENTLGAPCAELERAEDVLALGQALAILSDMERAVLNEIYWHDAFQSEVAEKLGCSQSHISRVQKAALMKLRTVLMR